MARRHLPEILLCGFEPFDGDRVNPSWEVARSLDGSMSDRARVRAVRLPCVFGEALDVLDQALEQRLGAGHPPVLIVALGLAGGRTMVSPERVALNIDDARIPDNAGHQPIDTAIVAGGPAAYFSSLPIKAIVEALRASGLPAAVSNSAGTFVCNHVFYGLMHRLATRKGLARTRGGFVHLPALPEQAARTTELPSLDLSSQIRAVHLLLRTALATPDDRPVAGGSLH